MSILDGGSGNAQMDILKLMADPAALKDRIAQFEAAQAAAEKAIAVQGLASEIPGLNAKAKADAEAARLKLADATAQASALIAAAEKQADEIVASAKQSAQDTLDHAAQIHAAADTASDEATAKMEALNAKAAQLDEANEAWTEEHAAAEAAVVAREQDAATKSAAAQAMLDRAKAIIADLKDVVATHAL